MGSSFNSLHTFNIDHTRYFLCKGVKGGVFETVLHVLLNSFGCVSSLDFEEAILGVLLITVTVHVDREVFM